MRKAMLTVFLLTIFAFSAQAEGIQLKAAYQPAADSVKVAGTYGTLPQQALSLQMYPSGQSGLSAEDIKNGKGFALVLYTQEKGAFSAEFQLPDSFGGGKYTLAVGNETQKASVELMYISRQEVQDILAQLNQQSTQAAFGQVLQENTEKLGMEEQEYLADKEFYNSLLFAQRPAGGYTADSLFQNIQCAQCIRQLKNGGADLDKLLEQYDDYLETDYQTEVKGQSAAVKEMLLAKLKAADYKTISLSGAVSQNLLLSQILCTGRYTELQTVMEKNFTRLGLSLTEYQKIDPREKVFKEMFGLKNEITAYDKIAPVFYKAVGLAAQNPAPSGGGSGSGSGGNGRVTDSMNGSGELPAITPIPEDEPAEFTDMEGHWAKEAVEKLARQGMVNGFEDGTFRPEQKVTRAEFTKLLVTVFGLKAAANYTEFTDVPAQEWYAPYIQTAAGLGMVNGAEGRFLPDQEISRQDAAVILYRYLDSIGKAPQQTKEFADQDQIADYARQAAAALAGGGILNGSNGYFLPEQSATRAEAAKMMANLLEMGA